tara:strand:- start:95 stop:436 length:342 start_codon:yes stop_codon:yes gene_type:complete
LPLIGPSNAVGVRSEKASQSSRFRGVSWDVSNKTWNVRIRVDGENTRIGCFSDEEKAGRAFDKYIVENKLGRPPNFPDNEDVVAEAPRVQAAPQKRKTVTKTSHTLLRGLVWS